jgi:hypothetical protein
MFELGQVVITRNCSDYVCEHNIDVAPLIRRHLKHDWGDLCKDDKILNDQALVKGNEGRIFSSYNVNDTKIWIITEFDRSYTTIMLPEDY